jgi:hypothetical protein
MPRERNARDQGSGRSVSGLASLWHRVTRGFKRPSGDQGEDRWTWFGEEPSPKRSRRRLFLILAEAVAGIALIATGAMFVVLRAGDADDTTGAVRGTSSPAPSASVAPPTSSPSVALSPTPIAGSGVFQLAIWDSPERVWETDDLIVNRPEGPGGLSLPFLLRIENASPGQAYHIELTYGCGPGEISGLEFLTDFDRSAGSLPAMTAPGPERTFPDAAAVISDDVSIVGDDEPGDRLFRLWGATFAALPSGPRPQAACEGEKTFTVSVRALDKTVYMLWGAQLDPAVTGGASRPSVFSMKVAVQGIPEPAEVSVVVPR